MYKKCFIINIKYSHHNLDTLAFTEFSKDQFIKEKNLTYLDAKNHMFLQTIYMHDIWIIKSS